MKISKTGEVIREEEYKAILVGVEVDSSIDHSLAELSALAESAGVQVAGVMTQKLDRPDPRCYIGSGKLMELSEMCEKMGIDTVIMDDELSSSQIRHIEEALPDIRVIDRTVLILDIFAARAKSKEGKLQVELAQLQYRMPRLKGLGTSLSRLGGGIGTRGPGEKKLETDRRHITKRMDDIKKSLKDARTHREVSRVSRRKSDVPIVALVGYTNAGKSATMNRVLAMTDHEDKVVLEEDKLFATLDTFQRRIRLDSNEEFVLVDTVGFVSKLPHNLVEAFKATLEEVVEADLLLHIVDASYAEYEFQMEVVDDVLKELGADENPQVLVYNKMDIAGDVNTMQGLEVSAKTGEGFDKLLETVKAKVFAPKVKVKLLIPFDRGDIVSHLIEKANVLTQDYDEKGTILEVELTEMEAAEYAKFKI